MGAGPATHKQFCHSNPDRRESVRRRTPYQTDPGNAALSHGPDVCGHVDRERTVDLQRPVYPARVDLAQRVTQIEERIGAECAAIQ